MSKFFLTKRICATILIIIIFEGSKKKRRKKRKTYGSYTPRDLFFESVKSGMRLWKAAAILRFLFCFWNVWELTWPYGGYFACPLSLKENVRMWERHYEWERFFLRSSVHEIYVKGGRMQFAKPYPYNCYCVYLRNR